MLKFRSASVSMIILAALVLLLMIFRVEAWWLLIPVTATYLVMLVAGSIRIRSGFYIEALCRGNTNEKIVALTFDDGPDEVNTFKILDILEKYHVTATFFIIGKKAKGREELLKMISSKGHQLGNHSFSHDFLFDFFGRKKMERDLLEADEIILKAAGRKPLLFRPPYGVTNPTVARVVKKNGYSIIGWSIRSFDTMTKDADKITERIIKRLHPGGVILMHDTQDVTPEALEMIIRKAKEDGYRFAGLKEIFGNEAYKN